MGSGTLHRAGGSRPERGGGPAVPTQQRSQPQRRARPLEPVPDEPVAVVVTGAGPAPGALVDALLDPHDPRPGRPPASYLVARHGVDRVTAHVPGLRAPQPWPPDAAGPGPRPPRRIELVTPHPLLRHFTLVEAPDAAGLGVAGATVLLDAVDRGGALLFVLAADRRPGPDELDLLGRVAARSARVFFALVPGADGGWNAPGGPAPIFDPASVAVDTHRADVLAAVPELEAAPWFALDPAAADTAYLRRALVEWADTEALRRAGLNPPVPPGATRTVRVAPRAHESGWARRLDRSARAAEQLARRRVTVALADAYPRMVHEILLGAGGCAGLPSALDRELHAVSLRVVGDGDRAVGRIVDETLGQVLGEPPAEGVRRRVVTALRRGFADDPETWDLARVFLVTTTAGVAVVPGTAAVAALDAYPRAVDAAVLPPLGVALTGGCYLRWRSPANADPEVARSWVRQALRAVEQELLREISRRFEAVRQGLATLLADAVDHGILLA